MITVISKYIVRPSASKCMGNFILGHRRAAQIDQFNLMLGLALCTTEYFKIPGSMSSCQRYMVPMPALTLPLELCLWALSGGSSA